jgi:hypothetical protein
LLSIPASQNRSDFLFTNSFIFSLLLGY